ncbi:metallophosphoesterase family protein [Actinopolymorpha cephalotaxi]|nr:metallophosphoesterase [Actinopolymorpha cephalotaxi]NYH86062.1 hypothetical protein [Actinopolymorpha cephalotaxi]
MPDQPQPPESDLAARTDALRRTVTTAVRAVAQLLVLLGAYLRKPAMVAGVVLLAGAGAWFGMAVLGTTSRPIGPVETSMRLVPSLHGESVLSLPPLGTLTINSHDGPLQLDVTVDRINQDAAKQIFEDPTLLAGLEGEVINDVRRGVYATAGRGLVAGTFCAMLVTLIAVRRPRPTLVAGGAAAVAIAGIYSFAGLTLHPRAISEPRYTGLLTGAPSLIGDAEDLAHNFDAYSKELVRLVTNVTKLYDVTATLPAYQPDSGVTRVLHVSDLHLGEHAWDVIASVVKQYRVDVIVDSGDITDHGTVAENVFLNRIPSLKVPYVWVRGNHDSTVTEDAMKALPNAVVLDGSVRTVKGITFLGAGDPRFTPDRSNRNIPAETEAVVRQAIGLGRVADKYDVSHKGKPSAEAGATPEPTLGATPEATPGATPGETPSPGQTVGPNGEPILNPRPAVDAIVFHDSAGASSFDGKASLILTGHAHKRLNLTLPKGSLMMQEGTTGGAGLRALEKSTPAPIEMSVLYLDKSTQELEAWDEITLGGLGLTSAQIERHQVRPEKATTPSPVPTPTGPYPDSPLPTPTITRWPTDEPTETPGETPAGSPPASPSDTSSPAGAPARQGRPNPG